MSSTEEFATDFENLIDSFPTQEQAIKKATEWNHGIKPEARICYDFWHNMINDWLEKHKDYVLVKKEHHKELVDYYEAI